MLSATRGCILISELQSPECHRWLLLYSVFKEFPHEVPLLCKGSTCTAAENQSRVAGCTFTVHEANIRHRSRDCASKFLCRATAKIFKGPKKGIRRCWSCSLPFYQKSHICGEYLSNGSLWKSMQQTAKHQSNNFFSWARSLLWLLSPWQTVTQVYQMVRENFQEKMLNLHRYVIELRKRKTMRLNTQEVHMGQQCTFTCLEITM
jgi:hypothetical protein